MAFDDDSTSLATLNGGDPYSRETAAAARRLAAEPPVPQPPAPKPTWLDRIGGIFAKKAEDARTTYRRLLKKAELERKELSDAEVTQLAEVMSAAGISKEQAAAHRDTIRKHNEAETAAAKMEVVKRDVSRRQKIVDEIERQIQELLVKSKPEVQAIEDARSQQQLLAIQARDREALQQRVAEIFGE